MRCSRGGAWEERGLWNPQSGCATTDTGTQQGGPLLPSTAVRLETQAARCPACGQGQSVPFAAVHVVMKPGSEAGSPPSTCLKFTKGHFSGSERYHLHRFRYKFTAERRPPETKPTPSWPLRSLNDSFCRNTVPTSQRVTSSGPETDLPHLQHTWRMEILGCHTVSRPSVPRDTKGGAPADTKSSGTKTNHHSVLLLLLNP